MVRKSLLAVLLFMLAGCGEDTLPAAADGTDLSTCSDGTCEVLVAPGDVLDIPDLGQVEIAIDGDMLEVSSSTDDGQGNSSGVSAAGNAGKQLVLNGQEFTVVGVLDGKGVLRVG